MKKVFLLLAASMIVSLSSNCQWYYRHYGIYDINQLSQKQLNEYLSWTKENIVGWSTLTGLGTAGITALIIDASNALSGDLSVAYNILALAVLIPMVITSSAFIIVNTSRVKMIRGVMENSKLSLSLINYPSNIIPPSNITKIPMFTIAIYF